MSHQFDSGMFVNSKLNQEWHGLGTVVAEAPKTTAEAMQLAGMDWTVEESPVITYGSNDTAPSLVPGWKVLRRSDNNAVLHVCRESWTPVQNADAFAWFDPFIADGDVELSAAVSLQGGKRIAITARIKDGIADVVSGDPVEAFLLHFNSHNGSLCVGMKFTPIRTVCANTLEQALYGDKAQAGTEDLTWNAKTARIRHTKAVHENMDVVRDAIDIQRRAFRYSIEEYRAMAKIDMSVGAFDRYVASVFSKQLEGKREVTDLKQYEQLIQNFESGVGTDIKGVPGTLWCAYNAVTEWTTHQRAAAEDDQNLDKMRDRLNSLWFGSAAQINEVAHKSAMALV